MSAACSRGWDAGSPGSRRLPDGPLGRIVDGEARRHGVDTRWVRWIENARLGLMFYEPGPLPRTSRVIYDRKHSAASELGFEDAPWESLVQASAWLHLSGITPALGPSCRALVLHLAALAAAAGKPVSYDLNYRATLTNPADARAALDGLAAHLHLLVLAERDAQNVLGFQQAGEELATAIAARYGVPLVALTRPPDAEPGTLLLARGEFRYAPRLEVEVVDRIGAGNSFVAGLIHGLLDGDADLAIRSRRLCRGDRARHAGRHQLPRARGYRCASMPTGSAGSSGSRAGRAQHFTYRQVTRPVTIGPVT